MNIADGRHKTSTERITDLKKEIRALHKKIVAEKEERVRIVRDLELTESQERSLRREMEAKNEAMRFVLQKITEHDGG